MKESTMKIKKLNWMLLTVGWKQSAFLLTYITEFYQSYFIKCVLMSRGEVSEV